MLDKSIIILVKVAVINNSNMYIIEIRLLYPRLN